jgi:hypothetical protein
MAWSKVPRDAERLSEVIPVGKTIRPNVSILVSEEQDENMRRIGTRCGVWLCRPSSCAPSGRRQVVARGVSDKELVNASHRSAREFRVGEPMKAVSAVWVHREFGCVARC